MLLRVAESKVPMKLVYRLAHELKNNPDRVRQTQALTQDKSRPLMGLKGQFGLFGSIEWWRNIETGRMPLLHISGVVRRAYAAGQDASTNNTVELVGADGAVHTVGIYADDKADVELFQPGSKVEIVYALDPLKVQPAKDGGTNHSRVALEMAVSLSPTERG